MYRTKKTIFVILVISIFLMGCEKKEEVLQEVSIEELEEPDEKGASTSVFIHICGEVKEPGVYEMPSGSRIYEAVTIAGGFTEQAAVEALNQAQVLEDAQQLYVPSKTEIKSVETDGGIGSDGRVNLNKATREELMTLPGIGETKADAIIRHREQQGNFKSIEEIMEIEGIKEGVFHRIENRITVS